MLATTVAKGLGEDVLELGDAREAQRSSTSDGLVGALNDLDRRLSQLTGHRIDLKLAFPLALGGVGVWRLAVGGFGLAEIPAYVLLWQPLSASSLPEADDHRASA